MKRPLKKWLSLLFFLAAVVIVSLCYLTYNTYGNWSFALALRGKKLLAFIFVGIAAAFSTISFQTVTQNHFLTPNILGMDSLYVFVQTVLFFSFRRRTSVRSSKSWVVFDERLFNGVFKY